MDSRSIALSGFQLRKQKVFLEMENKPVMERMLLIGSTGRNIGKTNLACYIITQHAPLFPITGVKVTTVKEKEGQCPRGGDGCGVCGKLNQNYEIIKENSTIGTKDTSRLLAAGAADVYWLKVFTEYLAEGIEALLKLIPHTHWIVCESNSLRSVLQPALFIMLSSTNSTHIKPSAAGVKNFADRIIKSDGQSYDYPIGNIRLSAAGWHLREETE